jgi:hypothetical protein
MRRGVLISIFYLFSALSYGKDIKLQWDPSPEIDVAGYRVYWGEAGAAADVISVSTNEAQIPDLFEGITYFFYVTAFNTAGLESIPSETIEYLVPIALPDQPRLESPVVDLAGNTVVRGRGKAGAIYVLQATGDLGLLNWEDIQAVASDDTGLIEIQDSSSSDQKFYRLIEL